MATRDQVGELLRQGHTYETAAAELGIRPGLAYLIATGRPADDGDRPQQDLFEPPAHNPTRSSTVMDWVRERASRDLTPPSGEVS